MSEDVHRHTSMLIVNNNPKPLLSLICIIMSECCTAFSSHLRQFPPRNHFFNPSFDTLPHTHFKTKLNPNCNPNPKLLTIKNPGEFSLEEMSGNRIGVQM